MDGAEVRIRKFQTVQTQNLFDLSIDGNTVGAGTALVSSGTLTLVAGNNITLSQDLGNAITISGPVKHDVTIAGNSTSAGAGFVLISTGTLTLAGGNRITLSQNGNAITISGPALVGSTHQHVIDGNTSGTTATMSSGILTLAGGNNITLSQVGNAVTVSAMSMLNAGMSDLGNTAGTSGTVEGQIVFVGGTNISLSQSIDAGGLSATLTINGLTQSIQTQSVHIHQISGNTSGTTANMSTGTLVLVGGNNITLSQNVNSVTISAFNQSQQTQNIIRDVNIGGNTSGTLTDITSGTMTLYGGYNITLSQAGNAITISGPEALTAVVSDLGNTAGTTGAPVLMDKLIFVGGNNITLSQSIGIGAQSEDVTITISGANQTLQTSGLFQLTIGGNTSGTSMLVSSGTLTLAGGPNITVSQAGNAISISANSQSLQTQSIVRDVVIAGNTSGTTVDISSGTLTLAGGNNITLSQQGNAITLSAPVYDFGVSNIGNTSGTTGISTRRLVLAGGNSITLSQSIDGNGFQTVTISGPVFSNSNNFTFGSNAGTITASFAESQQTQNIIREVSISGTHTAGTLTDITSGTLYLAGGDNITLSQNGNSITISAGSAAAGSFSAGISTLGNTAGTTALVENQLVFVGSDNITLSQSVNGQSATLTIFGATVAGGSFSAGISTQGNTSGTTGFVSQQMLFVGGNNITLSQSINGESATLTISAFNQSVQTGSIIRDVNIGGNTTGTTAEITSGTLTIAGGNNITISQAGGNAITISAASQSVQTGSIVQAVVIASNTSGTTASVSSGTLQLAGGNNITLSQNQNSITISGHDALSAGASNLGNTAGTTGVINRELVFVGGNNITLSQSTGTGTASQYATLTISAFNQTNQTANVIDVTISGNTSGTSALVSSGTLTLAGGNNITLSQVGNAVTISAFNQTLQTQSRFNLTISGNTSGTGALVSSGVLTLVGGNNITVSQAGGNAITISGHPLFTAGMSNLGNTSGTSGVADHRLIIVGGNNITISQSLDVLNESGTITISAFNQSVQTGSIIRDVIISGNTSGTTANITSGTLTLVGGNNITLSQNGNVITISGGAGGGVAIANSQSTFSTGTVNLLEGGGAITIASSAGGQTLRFSVPAKTSLVQSGNVSLSSAGSTITISGLGFAYASLSAGNTSGTSALISSGTMYLAGGNNITLSQNGNSITISGGVADAVPTISIWQNSVGASAQAVFANFNTFALVELNPGPGNIFPGNMTVSTIFFDISFSVASSLFNNSNVLGTFRFGIYTRNASTLSILNSGSTAFSTDFLDNATVNLWMSIVSSQCSASLTFSNTQYYLGYLFHSTTANQGGAYGFSLVGNQYLRTNQRSGTFFGTTTIAGSTSMGQIPFVGVSVSSLNSNAALPASIQLSQLQKTGSNYAIVPHIVFMNLSSAF